MALVTEAPGDDEWRKAFEADAAELARSERLANQFRSVLPTLEQKARELEAGLARLGASRQVDAECLRLTQELEGELQKAREQDAKRNEIVSMTERWRLEANAFEQQAKTAEDEGQVAEAAMMLCEQRIESADARRAEALVESRCMVAADVLHRVEAEGREVKIKLEEQQAETARLRQALADTWAAREDPMPKVSADLSDSSEALDRMEEELRWLAEMQHSAAAEARHLKKLERTEVALHAELREASEQKAALQSSRVDINESSRALREAMAHQNEGYVRRCSDLLGARRSADEDRIKLLQECAELQERLDTILALSEGLEDVERRHAELEGERQRLVAESARLREVNSALGVLVMGDDAPTGARVAASEAVRRLLQLHVRFVERLEAHATEKQKLADCIRQLDRENATGSFTDLAAPVGPQAGVAAPRTSASASTSLPITASISSATSALRGSLERLLPK